MLRKVVELGAIPDYVAAQNISMHHGGNY